ncbi:hypothetical protein FraQA3DRAFT_2091 [Frankia sp. QA3]|nr:hypothetical protein [Frankia sp. QA3]EIV92515.1 hypothetical protein FraQA3DRAFT_2091 [Frankia sp. QA3]
MGPAAARRGEADVLEHHLDAGLRGHVGDARAHHPGPENAKPRGLEPVESGRAAATGPDVSQVEERPDLVAHHPAGQRADLGPVVREDAAQHGGGVLGTQQAEFLPSAVRVARTATARGRRRGRHDDAGDRVLLSFKPVDDVP